MTLKEYTEKRKELKAKRDAIDSDLMRLKREFMNSKYNNEWCGRKVKCFRKTEFVDGTSKIEYIGEGCVCGIKYLDHIHDIEYQIAKIKSDGNMSKQMTNYRKVNHIEFID